MTRTASVPAELIGATGRRYRFTELLQERPHVGCVWTAMTESLTSYNSVDWQPNRRKPERFVLKDVPRNILSNFNERIWPRLCEPVSPFLRLPVDTIPDRRTLVYKHLTTDFLQLIREQCSMGIRRQILKASLQAIVDLHSRDVVHLDIKPDNIMVNCRHKDGVTTIENVQLTDLENAAHLPSGKCVKGMLAGNDNWRSPEAHFKGELSKPSDIFAFGLVCLYAVTGRVICGPDDDFWKHESKGALPAMIRLQRQVSYFGDTEGLNGLMKHVGDEEINCQILSLLWEERNEEYIPYQPFSEWPEAKDEILKDLIRGTMNLDPSKRFTAIQTLKHPWFAGNID